MFDGDFFEIFKTRSVNRTGSVKFPRQVEFLKVSKFRKQIMVQKLLPNNKPSSLSWKFSTSRLVQKRVYLLEKRTYTLFLY